MRQNKQPVRTVERLRQQEYLPYRFSIIAEAMSRHLAKRYVGRYGLKRHEWRLLHILSTGETMTTQDVIAKTSLDRLRVSRAAIRLEDKGFLARVTQPRDQRAHLLQLTAKGQKIFEGIEPLAREFQDLILSVLAPDEREALDGILDKLTHVLEDEGDFAGAEDAEE